jgi:predicted N-acyltransferase
MKDRLLFVLARDGRGRPVAGTINFYKDAVLFGRHWGAVEERRNLHFELCYYQTIEFAIGRGSSSSRPALRASTSSRAAFCPRSPTAPTTSGTRPSGRPSGGSSKKRSST